MPRQLWITFRFSSKSQVAMTPERIQQQYPNTQIKAVMGGFAFLAEPDERLQELMEEAWREIAKHDGVLLDIAVTLKR
jgi:hypothetical protein